MKVWGAPLMADNENQMNKWLKMFPPPSAPEREKQKTEPNGRQVSQGPQSLRGKPQGGSSRAPGASGGKPRGAFPAELDLHGLTQEEARPRLRDFLRNSLRSGKRKVLVIHGRGLHSGGGAVLPALVRGELEKNPHVLDFGPAEPSAGGSGATQVFLRHDKRWKH